MACPKEKIKIKNKDAVHIHLSTWTLNASRPPHFLLHHKNSGPEKNKQTKTHKTKQWSFFLRLEGGGKGLHAGLVQSCQGYLWPQGIFIMCKAQLRRGRDPWERWHVPDCASTWAAPTPAQYLVERSPEEEQRSAYSLPSLGFHLKGQPSSLIKTSIRWLRENSEGEWTMNAGPTYFINEKPKSKPQMHKLE